MKNPILIIVFVASVCASSCSTPTPSTEQAVSTTKTTAIEPKQGDLATRGGTATVRKGYEPQDDNPTTTDNERNNQPLGHMGTVTLRVHNVSSGNSYPVDADVENIDDGYELHRLYFLKGGWVDFNSCDLDSDYVGSCSDENGRDWEIEGES